MSRLISSSSPVFFMNMRKAETVMEKPVGNIHAEPGTNLAEQGHLRPCFGKGIRPGPPFISSTTGPSGRNERDSKASSMVLDNIVENIPERFILSGSHEAKAFDHLAHARRHLETLRPDVGYAEHLVGLYLACHFGHEFECFVVGRQQQPEVLGFCQKQLCRFILFIRISVNEIEKSLERGSSRHTSDSWT